MAGRSFIARHVRGIGSSGIRRVFDLAATMENPINFSIGQPDFPVPRSVKDAMIRAIDADHNGYTVTRGLPELRAKIGLFCNLSTDCVFEAKDADNIYDVPLGYHKEGVDEKVDELLNIREAAKGMGGLRRDDSVRGSGPSHFFIVALSPHFSVISAIAVP